MGLGFHLSQVHSTDIVTAIDTFLCGKLSGVLNTACKRLLDEFGPILIDQIYHNQTPDMICHNVRFFLIYYSSPQYPDFNLYLVGLKINLKFDNMFGL